MDKKLAISAAAALTVVAALASPAAAADREGPVGSWSGTVTRPGATEPINLYFSSTGVACLVTSDGDSFGSWTRTGDDTFNYKIKEAFIVNGVDEGWIYINQDARQDDESLASSGVSTVYGLDGSLLETTNAQVSADRTSTGVPSFCS